MGDAKYESFEVRDCTKTESVVVRVLRASSVGRGGDEVRTAIVLKDMTTEDFLRSTARKFGFDYGNTKLWRMREKGKDKKREKDLEKVEEISHSDFLFPYLLGCSLCVEAPDKEVSSLSIYLSSRF